MWSKQNSHTGLGEVQIHSSVLEDHLAVSIKVKHMLNLSLSSYPSRYTIQGKSVSVSTKRHLQECSHQFSK